MHVVGVEVSATAGLLNGEAWAPHEHALFWFPSRFERTFPAHTGLAIVYLGEFHSEQLAVEGVWNEVSASRLVL